MLPDGRTDKGREGGVAERARVSAWDQRQVSVQAYQACQNDILDREASQSASVSFSA